MLIDIPVVLRSPGAENSAVQCRKQWQPKTLMPC